MGGYEAPAEASSRKRSEQLENLSSEAVPEVKKAVEELPRRSVEREVIREENLTQEDRAVIDREKRKFSAPTKASDPLGVKIAVKDVIAKKELIEEDDGVTIKGVVERIANPEAAARYSAETSASSSPSFAERMEARVSAVSTSSAEETGHVRATDEVDIDKIHPNPTQPRMHFNQDELEELSASIEKDGLLQPILVREAEDGYEIIAGHRRQKASELAGFRNMPCIVREMTDDEAILAMTDDNLRHRERILPTEKAAALKQQVEAIKHQGARPGEDDRDAGKRSTQIVGDRNGMNYKQVQRYIRLTELVPDLQKMVDEKQLSFTPAVEISFIRPKHQKYIAVAIEGQASSPSLSQAQKMRELDKEGKLNGDVIDGILSEQKKEVDKVIINSAELEKYFGKDKTPREMKDTILALLDEWKEKQPPELGKPDKKKDMEK